MSLVGDHRRHQIVVDTSTTTFSDRYVLAIKVNCGRFRNPIATLFGHPESEMEMQEWRVRELAFMMSSDFCRQVKPSIR